MGISRVSTLHEIFKPWYIKVLAAGAAVPTALQLYDVGCNQFGWPKLPNLWNMTRATIPWWVWLLFAQAVFVYALFEYVRRLAPASAPNDNFSAIDMGDTESRLRANQDSIDRLIAEAEANRLELAGRIESSELIATARWGEQKKKAEILAAYLGLLNGKHALLEGGKRALDSLRSDPTAPGYERMNHIRSFATPCLESPRSTNLLRSCTGGNPPSYQPDCIGNGGMGKPLAPQCRGADEGDP